MKLKPTLVALVLVTVGASVAFAQPGDRGKKPKPEPPSAGKPAPPPPSTTEETTTTEAATATVAPSATEETTTSEATAAAAAAYPPPSTETAEGTFIVKCPHSHRNQVDPIVAPGTGSAHMHEFFANRSTNASSTYASMTPAGTTCPLLGDTAGYWTPTLISPAGSTVDAVTMFAYYKNRPVAYGTTVPFPPDFRMIAGGVGTYPKHVFWDCFAKNGQYDYPPACGDDFTVARIHFPNCWDGVHLDSVDHRSHVVYPKREACPQAFPVKLPKLLLFVRYPKNIGGPGWHLSDGTTLPHADFWNTWQQPALTDLVQRCLKAGVDCGQVQG